MPARKRRRDDGGIHIPVVEKVVPGRLVVLDEMLAQPRRTAARAAFQHFVAQTAQRPHLRRTAAQLAHGVVDLRLQTQLVRFAHVGRQFVGGEKRIVDVRIDFVTVMNVHDGRARLHRFTRRREDVKVALGPMRRIERFHRRHQQRKTEFELLTGLHLARARESGEDDAICRLAHLGAAASRISPGGRNTFGPQIGHMPGVLRALQLALYAGIGRPQPHTVVGPIEIPFPVPGAGANTTPAAQAHHVFGHVAAQRNL